MIVSSQKQPPDFSNANLEYSGRNFFKEHNFQQSMLTAGRHHQINDPPVIVLGYSHGTKTTQLADVTLAPPTPLEYVLLTPVTTLINL